MTYLNTQVLVPTERVEEFYEYYSAWLRNEPLMTAEASRHSVDTTELEPWDGPQDDGPEYEYEVSAAREIWAKLSPRAKALFETLASDPGRRFTAEELVTSVGIPNGIYGVAGVLAWPARHAQAAGFQLPVLFEAGEAGHGASYWMPAEAAESFRRAIAG